MNQLEFNSLSPAMQSTSHNATNQILIIFWHTKSNPFLFSKPILCVYECVGGCVGVWVYGWVGRQVGVCLCALVHIYIHEQTN